MNYSNKLKSPKWQKKRLKILERDKFQCIDCGDDETSLHIHHIAYHKEPHNCPDELLVTLCENCHNAETKNIKISFKNLIKAIKEAGLRTSDIDEITDGYILKSKI